jgi:hypothetical protein
MCSMPVRASASATSAPTEPAPTMPTRRRASRVGSVELLNVSFSSWGAETQSRRDLVLMKYSCEKVAPLDL